MVAAGMASAQRRGRGALPATTYLEPEAPEGEPATAGLCNVVEEGETVAGRMPAVPVNGSAVPIGGAR